MNKNQVIYLKPNIIVEPLVARYRASPYLLQPASAAMFLKRLVNKLLKSFINAPQAHARAVRDPRLKGGPFLTFGENKAESAKQLYEELSTRLRLLFELSDGLTQLGDLLAAENGSSLNKILYSLNDELRACIELTYDGWNRANYNINEQILYQSSYYDPSLQEFLIYEGDPDDKDFALTTPRLIENTSFLIKRGFNDEVVQCLLSSRSRGMEARQFRKFSENLGLTHSEMERFFAFFSVEPPRSKISNISSRLDDVFYFGHACVLIHSNKKYVLVDPFISYTSKQDPDRLTLDDIPDIIDVVVITHLHIDHFCIETLLNIKHKIKKIIVPACTGSALIDPSPSMVLKALGFDEVVELKDFQSATVSEKIVVRALPFQGEHGDLNVTSKAMFTVATETKGYLFVADARFDNASQLRRIGELSDFKIDVIFIGMESKGAPFTWLYGPLMACPTDRSHAEDRRLNGSCSQKAAELVNTFKASAVFVYALGREPWLAPIMAVEADGDTKIQDEIELFVELCHRTQKRVAVLCGTRQLLELAEQIYI